MNSPLVYFGGKRRVADALWAHFGDTPNFIEAFCGSAATLLARPHNYPGWRVDGEATPYETINDKDCYVANLWRALKYDWRGVADYADWPVNEADVFARHNWLARRSVFRDQMMRDQEYFDIRIAGYWLWESGLRIGSGAAIDPEKPEGTFSKPVARPSGIGSRDFLGTRSKPKNNPNGIHALEFRSTYHTNLEALSKRLRRVRVLCGDWVRVLTPVETTGIGLTAVLLDPPYEDCEYVYSEKSEGVSKSVREWALANGDDPMFRIALCGYREHEMPATWKAYDWKATGGYGNQSEDGQGRKNAELERVWFSPHCIDPAKGQAGLFDQLEEAA